MSVSQAQVPASRLADWSHAGLSDSFAAPSDVIDFVKAGARNDGNTPCDSVFEHITDSLNGHPAVIYLPRGLYYFTKSISLGSGMVLRGYSADSAILIFNTSGQGHLITVQGSISSVKQRASAGMAKGNNTVHFSSHSFQAGDYVYLQDNDSAVITSSWAEHSTGQVSRVAAVHGNSVTLNEAARRNYSAGSLYMTPLNMVTHTGIENLKIIRLDTSSIQTSNIYFRYAANCYVKCVDSRSCNFAHIELDNCTQMLISGCYLHRAFKYGDGGEGYGVAAQFGTGNCLVQNNIFDTLRHAMLVQAGANGNVFAYNLARHGVWLEVGFPADATGDIVLHGNYPYANLFEGNVVQNIVIDNSHGANGPGNTFFRNRADLYGILMSPGAGDSDVFAGNEVTNTGAFLGSITLLGKGHYQYGNNKTGSILPKGTDSLTLASLFADKAPAYYTTTATWPPIGIPNKLDAHTSETEYYYGKNYFTECSFPAPVKDTTYTDTTKADTTTQKDTTNHHTSGVGTSNRNSLNISVYPNPAENVVFIRAAAASFAIPERAYLKGSDGRIAGVYLHSSEISLNGLPDGLYYLEIYMKGYAEPVRQKLVKMQ